MFYIVLYEGIKPARVFLKEDAKLNQSAMGGGGNRRRDHCDIAERFFLNRFPTLLRLQEFYDIIVFKRRVVSGTDSILPFFNYSILLECFSMFADYLYNC